MSITSVAENCGLSNSCTGILVPATNAAGQPVEGMVIEYVSAICSFQPNVVTLTNYPNAPSTPQGVSSDGHFWHNLVLSGGASQQTRIYAASGTTIYATSLGPCSVGISGYLYTP
jgi:hypothetical protein